MAIKWTQEQHWQLLITTLSQNRGQKIDAQGQGVYKMAYSKGTGKWVAKPVYNKMSCKWVSTMMKMCVLQKER